MFGRIVLGLVIMLLGGALMYYSANLVEMLGRSSRAESHISGGTRSMWMLIGFGLIVVGGLIMFGILGLSNPADVNVGGF